VKFEDFMTHPQPRSRGLKILHDHPPLPEYRPFAAEKGSIPQKLDLDHPLKTAREAYPISEKGNLVNTNSFRFLKASLL